MRTYTDIARRLGLKEAVVRAVAEELELCGYRLARPIKINAVHVKAIRARYDGGGESLRSIADSTGFDWKTVNAIALRKTWQHVKDEPRRLTRRF